METPRDCSYPDSSREGYDVSQQITTQPPAFVERRAYPKINLFFNRAELIVKRSQSLIVLAKPALVDLLLLIHLVVDIGFLIWLLFLR